MSGPPVTIVPSGGLPVTAVESGAPVLTAVEAGGAPVTLVDTGGMPFVVEGMEPAFAAFSTAKYDGDSRTSGVGGRSYAAGSNTVTGGFGATYNMAGWIQPLCGNKWLLKEGFSHSVGGSSTHAMNERRKSTSISATGNPAFTDTALANDANYSTGSDGVATVLTQGGNHVISASVGVNDSAPFYNSPSTASQSLVKIAEYADALGAAGKVWYVGDEFPRSGAFAAMESKTVAGGTCTATNTTGFVDGETFGVVGVIGKFADLSSRPLTKVASAPAQDQYTVTSGGVYTFGGTAPATAYLNYNYASRAADTYLLVIHEWMSSSAANFTATANGVNYGVPGLLYNRPWVRVASTWSALEVSTNVAKRGTFDSLQLHANFYGGYLAAQAFAAKVAADYPSAPDFSQTPTRNNWYAARGTGAATTLTGTLPPSMRTGFTVTAAPTLISVNGAPTGKVDTATGAITGTGITSGTLNFSTGAFSVTFAVAPAVNAQVWFEQDIGNYNLATMTEGTIGRNSVMNGLMDMTAASGGNLIAFTGTSSVTGIAASAVPYGWGLTGAAMNTAITNATATIAAAAETDANGYPRFVLECSGYHTAAISLLLSQSGNSTAARLIVGDQMQAGGQVRYAKHSTRAHLYGLRGANLKNSVATGAVNRTFSSGVQSCTTFTSSVTDGGTGMYLDDLTLNAAGGALDLARIAPLVDTTGLTPSGHTPSITWTLDANVPFACRVGVGRFQARTRRDV